ncbi:hypothetical protein [Candidatus Contubernalis alkaliaceticus]|uniref:hypothetical protein n=1 Tax=Candidatus Contubernalis alkaliaceticus TaxID=338645 RepID=UPI001F4BEA95|nr:hypothetical protein [Candidatus Contubernalis alkalaceticus]UNC91683.1 hypothetical protein HUE98_05995 [Candidatus Contubernalis alkalaceticus]
MTEEKLCEADFRFIEKLLYEYKTYDTAIEQMEAELAEMYPSGPGSVLDLTNIQGHSDSSEPERWTIKRNESLRAKFLLGRIQEKKRHRKAMARARETLSDEENNLIWLKYDLRKQNPEVWRTMNVSESTFYRLRKQVVTRVAEYCGLT